MNIQLDNGVSWTLITSSTANDGTQSWTIPQVNSATCIVKASNSANVNSNDVSNAVFSILKPTVVVLTPNGGENLVGCATQTVSIQTLNTTYLNSTSLVYVEYSIDGGTTWAGSVGAFYLSYQSITNNISWTIPNGINSSQCRVRAYSYDYPTMNDTSNNSFTITPNNAITVTAPNGGETISALTNYTINWTNTAAASGLYNVQYSSDNGSSWTTIASSITGNSFSWTNIPNVPSSTYLVRVQDAGNTCKNDVSNANFTVTPAQPVLTYPNGGEQLSWGQSVNITWNAATFYSNIRLEYSTDNGVTWILITSSTSNDGTQSWTVPQVSSTKVLVKASNSSNVNSNDVSNAVFAINRPTVVVLTPNGGESYLGCNTQTVSIQTLNTTYLNSSSLVYVEYSTDGGTTWAGSVGAFYLSYQSITNNISWTIPNGINSNQCRVRAYCLDYPTMNDTSNNNFTISPNNAITVTAPNGGETIAASSAYLITWTNNANASGVYNIQYSADNGVSWNTIASSVSGNNYNWTTIPNIPGSNYLVRVQDAGNTCKNDVSNATFTVTPVQPVMTYPNGGEVLWASSSVNITWNSATYYGNVRLEYSLNNGTTWTLINSSTSNDGSQPWTIPSTNSTNCLVKVSNASNVNSNDVSNAVFTIKPEVTILTPNGLDQVGSCTQTSITFEHTPGFTTYNIEYSTDNGVTWNYIVASQTFGGTTGTYNWSIPSKPTSQALVRVSPSGYPALADVSDAVFTIKPSVTVTLPSFGGVLQAGSVYTIKWGSDGISNFYDLAYSTAGLAGAYTNIAVGYNTSTNNYNWTVPNTPSENCYIRIRDNVNTCKDDYSNFAFAIRNTAPPITVSSPNNADSLNGCQNYTINWTESGTPIGSYNIDLSADNGNSWTNVVTNYATTGGTYSWIVPNINTDQALIRVSSASVATINDISDLAFKIKARSIIAKPDTLICAGTTVQLRAIGGLGNFIWSPTSVSNSTIANPTAAVTATTSFVVSSSNGSCVIRDTATITVLDRPYFNITSDAVNVCGGQVVTLTAHVPANALTPSFQWKINNVNVGVNDSVLVKNNLANNDLVTCVLSYPLACFAPLTSNSLAITVNAKPNLGPDSNVTVSCQNCTVNLTTLYNTSGYAYVKWNAPSPLAATPGIYMLIVSQLNGCTCPDTDTAYVYVTVASGSKLQACVNSNIYFKATTTGSSYQWQVNTGSGFTSITDDRYYTGSRTRQLGLSNILSSFYGYEYRCLVNGTAARDTTTLTIIAEWTGKTDTNWENTTNWSCGLVPDRYTDVVIPKVASAIYPEVTCDRVCRSLFISQNTALKVPRGRIFLIKGDK